MFSQNTLPLCKALYTSFKTAVIALATNTPFWKINTVDENFRKPIKFNFSRHQSIHIPNSFHARHSTNFLSISSIARIIIEKKIPEYLMAKNRLSKVKQKLNNLVGRNGRYLILEVRVHNGTFPNDLNQQIFFSFLTKCQLYRVRT